MRVLRWRWVLVPMIVMVAGCLPRAAPALPRSFTEDFLGGGGLTFTVQAPTAGTLDPDSLVDKIRADYGGAFVRSRAVPVFGLLRCTGQVEGCQTGIPFGQRASTVWLVLYPDVVGAGGGAGWVLVDAVQGVDAGFMVQDPQ